MFEPKIHVTSDTWMNELKPTVGYGNFASLKVRTTDEMVILMNLAKPSKLRGTIVTAAPLTITVKEAWAGTRVFTAKRITTSWVENVDYDHRPTVTSTNLATESVVSPAAGDTFEIDLFEMLQDVADGASWYGIQITSDNATASEFYSSEAAKHNRRPFCSISYTAAPEAVFALLPNGDTIYTVEPVLYWDFLSKTPGAYQTKSQVQITEATDPTFAAVHYDSGEEDNVLHKWVTEDDAGFTDLTPSTDYIWRAKARDQTDWSEWSDTATMTVEAAGTVDITYPAGDGDDVSTDEPALLFEFAGQDMTTYAMRLYHYIDAQWVEILDGVELGLDVVHLAASTTDGSYTPVPGLLKWMNSPDNQYRWEVYVRDNLERSRSDLENLPSDERTFDFVFSGAVTAPTAPSATSDGPAVLFSWNYTSAWTGDFVIEKDGEFIKEFAYNAENVSNVGDVWTYRLHDIAPNESVELSIRAKSSAAPYNISNKPADITYTHLVKNIWICRGTTELRLLGVPEIRETLQQEGETHWPLNVDYPVRLSSLPKNWFGSLEAGFVAETNGGLTAPEQLQLFLDMYEDYSLSGEISLTFGDESFNVIIGDLQKSHDPILEEAILVSFNWWRTTRAFAPGTEILLS